MKLNKVLLLPLIASSFLVGCTSVETQNKIEKLEQEKFELSNQVDELKKEIEELKFGPEILIGEAKSLIDQNKYDEAKQKLDELLNKHPSSPSSAEATKLLATVNSEIEKINQQKELERQKQIEEDKKRLENATKQMRKEYDEIQNITWYYEKSTPKYTDVNSLHIYFGMRENSKPFLRFVIQYTADDWLFIQKYIIKAGNQTFEITPQYGEVNQDNNSKIWEWYDVPMDAQKYNIVRNIIESDKTIIRHEGQQYQKDRNLSSKEKQALKNVLDAYEALGGELNF